MIKPIQTKYKDCYFRSRLEARWAVFFDAMEIQWEYEKEGFILDDGTLYLPDFWLPESKTFVEVKPEALSILEERKCAQLAKMRPVIVVIGVPGVRSYERYSYVENVPGIFSLFDGDDYEQNYTGLWGDFIIFEYVHGEIGHWEFVAVDAEISDSKLENACAKAKQARFEHGQSG